MLEDRLGVSERRACRITGQHRSTKRHRPERGGQRDDALRARLAELSAEYSWLAAQVAPPPLTRWPARRMLT